MPEVSSFFATTAKGLEDLLVAELQGVGADRVQWGRAGAAFSGSLDVAYRACLWSRVASRILLPLAEFAAPNPQALYAGVRSIRWTDHIAPRRTLAVDFTTSHSTITHSHFGALKTKDAIVDELRERTGTRPDVAVTRPDVRVNVYLHDDRAAVSIDLSGESLHRRAYRARGGPAPLKENLAAAILQLADWPQLARNRVPFLDPMCGTGTLPIEAALIAADIAPGRARPYFGFLGWRGHQSRLWAELLRDADERVIRDPQRLPIIRGDDADAKAVRAALINVERAGLRGLVHIEKRTLIDCAPVAARVDGEVRGLLVVNPPYGERLGGGDMLGDLYATLGDTLRHKFTGWTGYVLTGNPDLAKRIGLRAARRHVVFNGALECRLLKFPISSQAVREPAGPHWRRSGNAHDPDPKK